MRSTPQQRARVATVLVLFGATAFLPTALAAGQAGDPGPTVGATSRPTAAAQNPTTTVILVRHAEKAGAGDPEFDPASPADPPLNAAGRERAALARTLGEAGVTAIYSSEFARTRQTVAPLAEALGLPVTTHAARDTPGLVETISAGNAGGTVVISGHSNTVPAIIEALGAGTVEAIEEAWEYDNLYFVVVDTLGKARVSTLKYGARSQQ
jgi:broad specificity phosphatase PhoE